ncbi:tRNA (mnm(5)s(2)U34)-methyltransferase [Risungbinella massiliensis]|uniref:tRNA (mnm(5)s(2)U34)-methyltransferase n=1 Tax=Risungbinella massiliensis TaxID=1329796 RepID=UPI0005CBAB9B|nr:class I SAM-dependent methyltransferase [Risungbinella massiliensis]
MISRNILEHAKDIVTHAIVHQKKRSPRSSIYVIDGTMGNGNDSLFLVNQLDGNGQLYALDIQKEALVATKQKLVGQGIPSGQYKLILGNHAKMNTLLPANLVGQVTAIMFNLGYLPGCDTSLKTLAGTTIPALTTSLEFLHRNGVLTVAIYTGHEGGQDEADQVLLWAKQLSYHYFVSWYQIWNRPSAPSLLTIEKRTDETTTKSLSYRSR